MPYQITPKCTNCGDCLTVCPLQAITPGDDRPRIDPDLCTDCGTCSDVCPARAVEGAAQVERRDQGFNPKSVEGK